MSGLKNFLQDRRKVMFTAGAIGGGLGLLVLARRGGSSQPQQAPAPMPEYVAGGASAYDFTGTDASMLDSTSAETIVGSIGELSSGVATLDATVAGLSEIVGGLTGTASTAPTPAPPAAVAPQPAAPAPATPPPPAPTGGGGTAGAGGASTTLTPDRIRQMVANDGGVKTGNYIPREDGKAGHQQITGLKKFGNTWLPLVGTGKDQHVHGAYRELMK